MNRIIAGAVVLAASGIVRADMGPPWPTKRVPVRVTITADPPPPGVELFIESAGLRRVSADTPVVLESDSGVMFTVYTVPTAALQKFDGAGPPLDWFRFDNPLCTVVGGGRVRGRLDFSDGRSEVVEEYRVERLADMVQVRRVSDNRLRWWQSGPCCFAVSAVPIGLIWLGVRLARRLSHRIS